MILHLWLMVLINVEITALSIAPAQNQKAQISFCWISINPEVKLF